MSVEGIVIAGRAAAEARMTSRCTIRRKTGETVVIDDVRVPVWKVVHEDLPLRLAGIIRGESQSRRVQSGSVEYEIAMRTAHIPASTTDLLDGDLIDVTSGDNAGKVYRIVEAAFQDQATARRVPVTEAQRPEEWS